MHLGVIAIAVFLFALVVGIGIIFLRRKSKSRGKKTQPKAAGTRDNAEQKEKEDPVVRAPSAEKQADAEMPRIAVSIPSYRDPELRYTLITLFKGAAHPQHVTALVLQQSGPDDVNEVAAFKHMCKSAGLDPEACDVRHTVMDFREARGPAFARAVIEREHLDGDAAFDYVLMVDSHTMFREGWDTYLVEEHRRCKEPERSVLSTYAPNYVRERRTEFVGEPAHPPSHYMYPASIGSDGMPRYKSQRGTGARLPAIGWAAGFSFAPFHVHRDVRYSSLPYFFFGEEFVMHARLFTHGYDVFVPPRTPLYTAFDRAYRPVVWKDLPSEGWEHGHCGTLQGVDQMFERQTTGRYALGRDRTLKQFFEFVGIDYFRGSVREVARLVLSGKPYTHPPVVAFKGPLAEVEPATKRGSSDPFGGAENDDGASATDSESEPDDASYASSSASSVSSAADSSDGSGDAGDDPFA